VLKTSLTAPAKVDLVDAAGARSGIKGRIGFATPPAAGMRLLIVAQEFELVRVHEFRRKDGTVGTLLDWRALCSDCAAPFVTTTVLGGGGPTRRCRTHRAAGKQVVPGPRRRLDMRVIQPEAAK
jgi:hypothetical protein